MKVLSFIKKHKLIIPVVLVAVIAITGISLAVVSANQPKLADIKTAKKSAVVSKESEPILDEATKTDVQTQDTQTSVAPAPPPQSSPTPAPVVTNKSVAEIAEQHLFKIPDQKSYYIKCVEKYESTIGISDSSYGTREEQILKMFRMYAYLRDGVFYIPDLQIDC